MFYEAVDTSPCHMYRRRHSIEFQPDEFSAIISHDDGMGTPRNLIVHYTCDSIDGIKKHRVSEFREVYHYAALNPRYYAEVTIRRPGTEDKTYLVELYLLSPWLEKTFGTRRLGWCIIAGRVIVRNLIRGEGVCDNMIGEMPLSMEGAPGDFHRRILRHAQNDHMFVNDL
jgi:hypothetical protein